MSGKASGIAIELSLRETVAMGYRSKIPVLFRLRMSRRSSVGRSRRIAMLKTWEWRSSVIRKCQVWNHSRNLFFSREVATGRHVPYGLGCLTPKKLQVEAEQKWRASSAEVERSVLSVSTPCRSAAHPRKSGPSNVVSPIELTVITAVTNQYSCSSPMTRAFFLTDIQTFITKHLADQESLKCQ